MPNSIMMLDHPAWLSSPDGRARRVVRSGAAVWSVVCTPEGRAHAIDIAPLAGEPGEAPVVDVIDPAMLTCDQVVCGPLRADGPVARLRNPDVWDALGTSVIRQVIRANQARLLYRRFCETHGDRHETAAGPAWLFPTPDAVLALSDEDFVDLGMKFFRRGLRAAAEASLKSADAWTAMPGAQLVTAVQSVPRIGPWTAGATAADVTNDFSLYPFADLAVRTWAGTLAPSVSWPEAEREFGRTWQAVPRCRAHRGLRPLRHLLLRPPAHGRRPTPVHRGPQLRRRRPDLAVILQAPPTTTAARVAARGAHDRFHTGQATSERERALYEEAAQRLAARRYPILAVDTSDASSAEVADYLASRIADLMEAPGRRPATA